MMKLLKLSVLLLLASTGYSQTIEELTVDLKVLQNRVHQRITGKSLDGTPVQKSTPEVQTIKVYDTPNLSLSPKLIYEVKSNTIEVYKVIQGNKEIQPTQIITIE